MNTAIIAVVVSCFVAFLGVVVIILCICVKRRNGYQLLTTNSEDDGLPTSNSISDSIRSRANLLKRYLKRYHLPDTLRLHKVGRHCELRKYVTNTLGRDFKRGHAYYEFTNEVENIPEGKEVLLQDKQNTNKWFRLVQPEEVPAGDIKFCGEGIPRSTFGQKYKVFIQSFGSGTRHLPRDSYILYNCEDQVRITYLTLHLK